MATASGLTHMTVDAENRAAAVVVDQITERHPGSKFIIVVNNMTGYALTRTKSVGKLNSWPFGMIEKDKCVASFSDKDSFWSEISVSVQYEARDLKPGVRTVSLSGKWPVLGYRQIGVFAGKNADYAWENLKPVSDCTDAFGNKATIREVNNSYVYEYELTKLGYEQYAVGTQDGDEAIQNALDLLATNGEMPGFVIIVNNHTEYNLYLEEEKIEKQGSWPLQNVGRKECAIGGLQRKFNMALAVQYTARDAEPQQRSIALAGSWPVLSSRKIFISLSKGAKYAWDNMHATPMCNEKGNRAYIQERDGSAIYVYDITNI